MADNTAQNGTATIAADDIAGVLYQRVKIAHGSADVAPVDASLANPLPVNQSPSGDTWVAFADNVAFAANKIHIQIFNATGSGKVVRIRKLFAINLATAAVVGIAVRFDAKLLTSVGSAGTAVTPVAHDTTFAALPAGITVKTGATTPGEGALLFPVILTSEEETAAAAFSKSLFQQFGNLMLEDPETHALTLRENQGMGVKQITSSTVGTYGWLMLFTVE